MDGTHRVAPHTFSIQTVPFHMFYFKIHLDVRAKELYSCSRPF